MKLRKDTFQRSQTLIPLAPYDLKPLLFGLLHRARIADQILYSAVLYMP